MGLHDLVNATMKVNGSDLGDKLIEANASVVFDDCNIGRQINFVRRFWNVDMMTKSLTWLELDGTFNSENNYQ